MASFSTKNATFHHTRLIVSVELYLLCYLVALSGGPSGMSQELRTAFSLLFGCLEFPIFMLLAMFQGALNAGSSSLPDDQAAVHPHFRFTSSFGRNREVILS